MLAELMIQNFALVENETFNFVEGLNILTGETGAGKSLIVDAMGFLLGATARDKPLRSGAKSGFVAARFVDIPPEVSQRAQELGFEEEEEGELLMSRDLKAQGRSSCRLNGRPATLSAMRELGGMLVDLHGQHQQYSLLKATDHLRVLDRFITSQESRFPTLVNNYQELYRRCRHLEQELRELHEGERARCREIDWAQHELQEIAAVDPQPQEDLSLEEEIKVLASASQLRNGALQAHANLNEEGGARDTLARACEDLASLMAKDARLEPIVENLRGALALIDDNIYELSAYAERVVADEGRLEELQNRHQLLRGLMSKYGPTLEDVLLYQKETRQRLEKLENSAHRSDELTLELDKARQERERLLCQLTAQRQKWAQSLSREVEAELAKVGMEHCRFQVEFAPNLQEEALAGSHYREIDAQGGDIVQFLIAPNPGEEPKPLAMIASGGEVSRIMLALLSLFSEFQKTATFFFDEIDAGLGGNAAQAVAGRLRGLASHSQVICITHLAILAVAADCHHHLYKEVKDGRTTTHVTILEGAAREGEIARMLSGDDSAQALEHARFLLVRMKSNSECVMRNWGGARRRGGA